MSLQALRSLPEDVAHAQAVLSGLDRCFLVGFGRLGPDQQEALRSLERVVAGTPLGEPVAAAVAGLGRSEFLDRHFAALAAARAAPPPGPAAPRPPPPPPPAGGRPPAPRAGGGGLGGGRGAPRHWLTELALAGFQQLEAQTLTPFLATLERLQGEPKAVRL